MNLCWAEDGDTRLDQSRHRCLGHLCSQDMMGSFRPYSGVLQEYIHDGPMTLPDVHFMVRLFQHMSLDTEQYKYDARTCNELNPCCSC